MNLQSHYATVKSSRMHYLEMGAGDPILFLHGMPTSSYIWRHVIPVLSDNARCIALDLIGMGKSDKPDIAYRVFDHIAYLDAFIDALQLKNITLVLHGWGSVIGLDYARRHENNIKAIACYESHLSPPTDWRQLSLPMQQFTSLLRNEKAAHRAIVDQNYLVEKMLPRTMIHKLSEKEMQEYRAPFPTPESRKPLWQYVQELPMGDAKPHDVVELIRAYSNWLQKTTIPKLLLYAVPGFITTIESVQWSRDHLPNSELICLDDVLHCAQESAPEQFAQALLTWYKAIK